MDDELIRMKGSDGTEIEWYPDRVVYTPWGKPTIVLTVEEFGRLLLAFDRLLEIKNATPIPAGDGI